MAWLLAPWRFASIAVFFVGRGTVPCPIDPVPELQGAAKQSKEKAKPIISGTTGVSQKVYHTERPIPSDVYPAIDTDLARDNLENDLTAADREDL